MNRCNEILARVMFAVLAAVTGISLIHVETAAAQGIRREAPADVVLGRLVVTAPPEVTVDGKPERLSPGSRIRDLNNMLVLSAGIMGRELPVVYKRDPVGLVHEVWLLTEEEYRKLGGGSRSGGPDGHKRFAELLALVFAARR
jgi:hypothetical protein